MVTFSELEWHVVQIKLKETIFVGVLFEFQEVIQTEKTTRDDVCSRPFRNSKGNSDRERYEKRCL